MDTYVMLRVPNARSAEYAKEVVELELKHIVGVYVVGVAIKDDNNNLNYIQSMTHDSLISSTNDLIV